MSYIGSPPKQSFTSGLLDRFTSTTGTTVTLTHDIASENDIVVFVNFVKQDSTTYSVGGTGNKTLTLGGTLVSSDIVEVHYLNIVGQTVNPSANSVGSSQLTADVITGQTALAVAPDSTDELLISDGGTLKRVDVSLVGGTNTPAFKVYLGSNQTVSNSADTRINLNTEVYDTDNAYDNSSNYRFTVPSGKGGKYYFGYQVWYFDANAGSSNFADVSLRVNNTNDATTSIRKYGAFTNHNLSFSGNTTLNLNAGDYVELWSYTQFGSGTNTIKANNTAFQGFKIIT